MIAPGVAWYMAQHNEPFLGDSQDCEPPDGRVERACANLDMHELRQCDPSAINVTHLRFVAMIRGQKSLRIMRYMVKEVGICPSNALDVACGERNVKGLIALGADAGLFTFFNSDSFREEGRIACIRLLDVNGFECADNFSHPENIFCALGVRILAGAVLPVHIEIWFNTMALIHDLPFSSCSILIEKLLGRPCYRTDDDWSHIARCHNTFEKQGMLGVVKVKFPMIPDAHLMQKYVDVVMRAVRGHRCLSGPPSVNYGEEFPEVFGKFSKFLARYRIYKKMLPVKIYVQRVLVFDDQVGISGEKLLGAGLCEDNVEAFKRRMDQKKYFLLHAGLPCHELENCVIGEEAKTLAGMTDDVKRKNCVRQKSKSTDLYALVQKVLEQRDVCKIVMSFL